MKRLLNLSALAILGAVGSVCYGASPKIDFKAVDPVIQSLVDAVIAADDTVDYTMPRFDEKVSNLRENRLKYDAEGSIKDTPWLKGGRATVTASATFEVDATESHDTSIPIWGGTQVAHYTQTEATARVQTDVLAFFRYWAGMALEKGDFNDPKYAERAKAHLKRLGVATSLDEVYNIIYSARKLSLEPIQDELTKMIASRECAKSFACYKEKYGQWYSGDDAKIEAARQESLTSYNKRIDEQMKLTNAYNLVQFNAIRASGRVTALQIIVDQKAIDALPHVDHQPANARPVRGEVVISEDAITSTISSWGELAQKDYVRLKSDLTQILGELQEGNVERKQKVQDGLRKGLIAFKKALHGQPQ